MNKNYPNPFSNSTTIEFKIERPIATVSLLIYDSKGKLVNRLFENTKHTRGEYEVKWLADNEQAEQVKDGIYFYKLVCDGEMLVKKAIVVK